MTEKKELFGTHTVHTGTVDFKHGTYVGEDDVYRGFSLKGKTALLMDTYLGVSVPDGVFAQFDDTSLPCAYGWHLFPANDFVVDQEAPESTD